MAGHGLQSNKTFQHWMRKLRGEMGVDFQVLSVDYPLAPEHPFPAAMHAGVAALEYLVTYLVTHDMTDVPVIIGKGGVGE